MRMAVISNVEEHSQYIGPVYQEHYARLHNYFQAQLGNTPEVENCVQETIRHLFFFMETRCWETDAEYVPVYLMRIAGALLCAKKVAAGKVGREKTGSLFGKITNELIQPFKARLEFGKLLRWVAGEQPWTRRVPSLRRAPATTV